MSKRQQLLVGTAVIVVLSAAVVALGAIVHYTRDRSSSGDGQSATVADSGEMGNEASPAAEEEEASPAAEEEEASPAAEEEEASPANNDESYAVIPPPARLAVNYVGGEVAVRAGGNLELWAKNAPISFGEPAASDQEATPGNGEKVIVIPGPRVLATDSTNCTTDQVEYRVRSDGNIEVVTRDCTRITRWQ